MVINLVIQSTMVINLVSKHQDFGTRPYNYKQNNHNEFDIQTNALILNLRYNIKLGMRDKFNHLGTSLWDMLLSFLPRMIVHYDAQLDENSTCIFHICHCI